MTQVPLPVDRYLPKILSVVADRHLVLVAPPGSGKTTRIPPALSRRGETILLQPRRVAARSIARRIASEQGWSLGEEVGWQVRFERRFGPRTRLLVATEGILTARLQSDPFLTGFQVAVLDEFHERSIHSDLSIAFLKQAAAVRDDLRIVVMSATLDAAPVADYLGNCAVMEIDCERYPVEVDYAPEVSPATAIGSAIKREGGHLLCFLPGAGEIARVQAELLSRTLPPDVAVHPLHGSMDAEDQDRVLAPSDTRKIILCTNIAETSLTVEGVTDVIDIGYHKVSRYDPRRGIDRLELERIPADSAAQRAGRAGRTGPGRALRLWPSSHRLRDRREPEILRTDLAGPCLAVLGWGGDPNTFDWFEPPESYRIEAALRLLGRLGMIRGPVLTQTGRQALKLPVHPRLSAVLISADFSRRAARACALLSERPFGGRRAEGALCDLPTDDEEWNSVPPNLQQAARELSALARESSGSRAGGSRQDGSEEAMMRALLCGFFDRVARRRAPGSDRLVLATGSGARLSRSSSLRDGEYLLALEFTGTESRDGQESIVAQAGLIREDWLGPTHRTVHHEYSESSRAVRAVEREWYDALLLVDRPAPVEPAAAESILETVLESVPLDEENRILLARCRLAGIEVDLKAVRRRLVQGAVKLPEFSLRKALTFPELQMLDRTCPSHLRIPSGRQVQLDYREDGSVRLAARIQELFGLRETPVVGVNRIPVVMELLAPNGRVAQTTGDLRNFWAVTYFEVRKQLRGRYPKHAWPEDPLTATPSSGVRRKG